MSEYRRKGWKPTWQALWAHQEGICAYCDEFVHPKDASVDHVTPISKGGSKNHWSNVVMACQQCNSRKGDDYAEPSFQIRMMKRNGMMPTAPVAWYVPWLAELVGVDPNIEVGYA